MIGNNAGNADLEHLAISFVFLSQNQNISALSAGVSFLGTEKNRTVQDPASGGYHVILATKSVMQKLIFASPFFLQMVEFSKSYQTERL